MTHAWEALAQEAHDWASLRYGRMITADVKRGLKDSCLVFNLYSTSDSLIASGIPSLLEDLDDGEELVLTCTFTNIPYRLKPKYVEVVLMDNILITLQLTKLKGYRKGDELEVRWRLYNPINPSIRENVSDLFRRSGPRPHIGINPSSRTGI